MPFLHITGLMILYSGDNITTHVANPGTSTEVTRIRYYSNLTRPPIADSGDIKVPGRGTTAMNLGLVASNEVWAEIEASSEILVPMCYFVRAAMPGPGYQIIALFKGNDFAVFDPAGKRMW